MAEEPVWDHTINFEDPNLNKIIKDNLTETTKEKKAIDMVNAVEQQLNKFAISEEGLANANLLLGMMTKWYGENADIIEDGDWLFAEKEKKTWQTKLEETIGKISVKIAEIHNKLDKNWEDFVSTRTNYNALMAPAPYQEGGRTRKRKRRRKRKTRKRKRKKSRKKRKRRRRRTRK